MYEKFKEIDGSHPWRDVSADGYVDYQARIRSQGRVLFFNFPLAKEMELIPEDHLSVINKELEQVILNLVTNAAEAMKQYDGEKRIELSTGLSRKGKYIQISVKDTGPGIPYAHQSKIFDPFYTTKANSSGIGLSICHRIVLDHGGSLKFNPGKNKGAHFLIELPLDETDRT